MTMLIYNGCRISELLNLKTADVDIDRKMIIIRDAKTAAGDRRIPIHDKLLNLYGEFYNEENEYFLTNPNTGKKYSYENFRDSYFDQLRDLYGWDSCITPHALRKTFSSMLKKAKVDSTYQKLLLGHEGALDLTEKVYTHVDDEQLIEAVNKLTVI